LADQAFERLKRDPRHASLRFKKSDTSGQLASVVAIALSL
jgi:hypothetical protein